MSCSGLGKSSSKVCKAILAVGHRHLHSSQTYDICISLYFQPRPVNVSNQVMEMHHRYANIFFFDHGTPGDQPCTKCVHHGEQWHPTSHGQAGHRTENRSHVSQHTCDVERNTL